MHTLIRIIRGNKSSVKLVEGELSADGRVAEAKHVFEITGDPSVVVEFTVIDTLDRWTSCGEGGYVTAKDPDTVMSGPCQD